ncbi:MAG: ATP-binding protein [Rhizobacter sp.]
MSHALAYHFGNYRLVPAQRALYEGELSVKLGARALDMLLTLVERRERVVGKDELLAVVWPGLVVEENNLQVQVVALRKLLGYPAISTIPGRGYRFTLPVRVEGDAVVAPPPPAPAAPGIAGPELIGRDDDLKALLAMIDAHPLVTVAGAGGIGKTRLARAAAARWSAAGQPTHFVDLAQLTDAELIARSVGRALGFSVDGASDPAGAAIEMLRDKAGLLVLDNAEHLLDGVAAFVETLRAQAPAIRVLVTSQEHLRATGEQVFRTPPLSLPESDDAVAAGASGAVAMFVARAAAVDRGFRLGPGNAAAVADICRRLDGIPLAIELAAGRVGLLGLEGLRQRLNERFHVLTAGARVALRRHQTLRAALEWSHSLLGTAEQAVFRRLGCFVGAFTLEAAQSLAEDDAIDRWDVLEHLGSLVDKSIVLAAGGDVPRYRMLETTRLYALERLAEAGETEAMVRRHAVTTAELLATSGRSPRRWLSTAAQFEDDVAEVDNARAALDWAAGCSDASTAIDVAAKTSMAFVRADLVNEYFTRLLPFRARLTHDLPPELLGLFWLRLAIAGTKSAGAEAAAAAQHAVEVYRRLADPLHLHEALSCAVLIGANRVDAPPLQPLVDEAAALEEADWPGPARSFLRWAQYRSLRRAGHEEQALHRALEQGELSALRDPVFTLRLTGVNVVDCEIALGRLADAEARARATLAALAEAGIDDSRIGAVHEGLALSLILQERIDEALPVAREAQRRLSADGDDLRLLEPLAWVAARRDRPEDAARLLGHVDAAMARLGLVRWPAAVARRTQLDALLAGALPAERLRALHTAGAGLTRRQAYALVLAPNGTSQ